eukprot:TRINITY_DN2499_c2_g1_i1.p1 TRINITY_DN2499_c2_g1~~TRINITY_DN2499_c2_g1_i1.p1  ORF type:complete len:385 (+),score=68.50 TRINITY_DN2499_c2_g1_i1:39-1157(+)
MKCQLLVLVMVITSVAETCKDEVCKGDEQNDARAAAEAKICVDIFRKAADGGETGLDREEATGVSIVENVTNVTTEWTRDGVPRGTAEWIIPDNPLHPDWKVRVLFLHGGGYSSYSPSDVYRPLTTRLAKLLRLPILAIDYRLVPEHPFPAGVEDAVKSLSWLWRNSHEAAHPADKVFVIGDSAGSGMALSLFLSVISGTIDGESSSKILNDVAQPTGGVLLSAYTDLSCSLPSYKSKSWDPVTGLGDPIFSDGNSTEDILGSVETGIAYLPADGRYSLTNPIASPYWAPMAWLAQLPPIYMVVGGAEIMLDDTVMFVEKTKKAGNLRIEHEVYPRMWHDHPMYTENCIGTGHLGEAHRALENIKKFIYSML